MGRRGEEEGRRRCLRREIGHREGGGRENVIRMAGRRGVHWVRGWLRDVHHGANKGSMLLSELGEVLIEGD